VSAPQLEARAARLQPHAVLGILIGLCTLAERLEWSDASREWLSAFVASVAPALAAMHPSMRELSYKAVVNLQPELAARLGLNFEQMLAPSAWQPQASPQLSQGTAMQEHQQQHAPEQGPAQQQLSQQQQQQQQVQALPQSLHQHQEAF
jgi:hypothetical protein